MLLCRRAKEKCVCQAMVGHECNWQDGTPSPLARRFLSGPAVLQTQLVVFVRGFGDCFASKLNASVECRFLCKSQHEARRGGWTIGRIALRLVTPLFFASLQEEVQRDLYIFRLISNGELWKTLKQQL